MSADAWRCNNCQQLQPLSRHVCEQCIVSCQFSAIYLNQFVQLGKRPETLAGDPEPFAQFGNSVHTLSLFSPYDLKHWQSDHNPYMNQCAGMPTGIVDMILGYVTLPEWKLGDRVDVVDSPLVWKVGIVKQIAANFGEVLDDFFKSMNNECCIGMCAGARTTYGSDSRDRKIMETSAQCIYGQDRVARKWCRIMYPGYRDSYDTWLPMDSNRIDTFGSHQQHIRHVSSERVDTEVERLRDMIGTSGLGLPDPKSAMHSMIVDTVQMTLCNKLGLSSYMKVIDLAKFRYGCMWGRNGIEQWEKWFGKT